MTEITEITRFANRMKAAINQAVYAMECKSGYANDKSAILAMMHDILNNGSRMVEECTGKQFALTPSMDSIRDDLSDAFDALIAKEEREAEQRRDGEYADRPFSKAAVASVARDVARA